MKNGPLPVILLALLLIAGLAGGAYFMLNADGDEQESSVSKHDDSDSKACDLDGDPSVNKPDIKESPDNPNNGNRGEVPQDTSPDPTDPKTDVVKPEPTLPKPPQPVKPEDSEWVESTYETKIHGTVRYKKDNRPVPGAEVTAEVADTSGDMAWGGSARAVASEAESDTPKTKIVGSTTTDNNGKYELTLKVTTYQSKSDSSDKDVEGFGVIEDGWSKDNFVVVAKSPGFAPAKSSRLNLKKGEDAEVNLSIAIPAIISGRVIDASTGKGIAGASITLNPTDTDQGWGARIKTTTDSDGQFKVDVSAGQFVIRISAEGYANKGGWQSGVQRIDATAGGEILVDDISLLKAGSIIGIIVDDEGEPLVNAKVTAEESSNAWGGSSSSTTTDKDGVFKIESLKSGGYKLKANADGFALKTLEDLKLMAGQTLDVGTIALDRGVSLIGTVSAPDGTPIANAFVVMNEKGEGGFVMRGGTEVGNATTDVDGNFEIDGLTEGIMELSVRVEGYASYKQDIDIKGSGNRADIKLLKGGSMVGLIKDASNLVVANAKATIVNHDSQAYTWYKISPGNGGIFGGDSVQSGEDGRFEFLNVVPGTYLLFVSNENGNSTKIDHIKVENDRATDVGTLKFEGPGAARITVLEDGKPLREVKVSLVLGQWGGGDGHSGVTDSDGKALIEEVPVGTYMVRTDLERDTFDTDARTRRSITIVAGKTVEFTLELRPQDGVHLFGRVTMNGNNVFKEVLLAGQGPLANTFKSFKISDGGMYEFHGLKHGTYQLHAKISDDRPTAFENVTVTKDGDFEFTRDFRGVVVSGTVNTPNNSPEERAAVVLLIQDKRLLKSSMAAWLRGTITVNNDGKFELANVPEGEFQITAELAGVGTDVQEVTIQGGDVSGLSLSVEANSGSLTVTVNELVGKAISTGSFAQAQLFDSDGKLVTFSEQMAGLFSMGKGAKTKFPMVKPGTYVLKVSASGYLVTEIAEVVIKLNEKTEVEVTMQASSELHVTATNSEITQAMLDSAVVTVIDEQGVESAPVTSMLEMWANQGPPAVPTLIVRYLPPTVREIRIKLEGYAEFTVQVDASTGNKNEKQETLIAE